MASSSFEFWLTDDAGTRLAFLEPRWWQYLTVVNGPGWFSLGLEEEIDPLLAVDNRVEIWRRPANSRLGLEMVGLINDWEPWSTDDWEGTRVTGPDIEGLLERRIIGYHAEETESSKTDYADDMMKEMWGENMGGGAIAARDWTGLGLSLAPDLSDGPVITKAFAWRNLLKALRDVNGASKSGSANPITISQAWGNLKNPTIKHKHSRERNYAYVGGPGQAAERQVTETDDAVRIASSQWNRREMFVNATQSKTAAARTGAGNNRLAKERPTITFTGSLVDIPEARSGVDWFLGDKATAGFRGEYLDVIIRAVQVSVNTSGKESIVTKLEYQA